jgi:hypothetical protein
VHERGFMAGEGGHREGAWERAHAQESSHTQTAEYRFFVHILNA